MIDAAIVRRFFEKTAEIMKENKDSLIALDSAAGDGDLGLSMEHGFDEVNRFAAGQDETDIGKLIMLSGAALNEASPSTLGTILSVGMMAVGKTLRGKELCGLAELAEALGAGNRAIMERAKSKTGDKTILDAFVPAQEALLEAATEPGDFESAFAKAKDAAEAGMLRTKQMKAVHGRAAYYAEKSIGLQDGGATVGYLLYLAAWNTAAEKAAERSE